MVTTATTLWLKKTLCFAFFGDGFFYFYCKHLTFKANYENLISIFKMGQNIGLLFLHFFLSCCYKLEQGSRVTVYLLFSTILKVMTQSQMLYSCWLDQDIAPPTIFSLASCLWRKPKPIVHCSIQALILLQQISSLEFLQVFWLKSLTSQDSTK